MLAEEGHKNSLGRANEVMQLVLRSHDCLEELYGTMFHEDAWVRMRAADAFEKVCRVQPEWIEPYIDRIQDELHDSTQPSIQWHVAEIYRQVRLNKLQKKRAIAWLRKLIATTDVDWIVAADCMKTLAYFVDHDDFSRAEFRRLVTVQLAHHSKSVARKAKQLLQVT